MPMKQRNITRGDRRPTYIRQWRQHHGLNQVQLCDRLLLQERMTLTAGHLSRIERGDVPYTQDLLEALARVLLCEPTDLIVRDPSDDPAILTLWAALEPVQKSQLTGMVQRMIGRPIKP